jgi:large subunit ribosomal protein L24
MQGGIIDKDMPMPASAVAIVCPRCGPSRVAARLDEDGKRLRDDKGGAARMCRKCGGDL